MTSWRSAVDAVKVLFVVLISLISAGARAQPADASLPAVAMDDPGTWLPDPDPFAPTSPVDPGVRGGPPGGGGPFPALNATELAFFTAALDRFGEVDSVSGAVAGEAGVGLGPTFNGNSCAQCHAQPQAGGTSPAVNPQVGLASLDRLPGREQIVPSFITLDGPVREARFIRNPDGSLDGGVHGVYTIAGRTDAPGCNLAQPNFSLHLAAGNVIFRIPTPTFGAGLIENVPDDALVANLAANRFLKALLGIHGKLNRTGNDGSITRFGWKAQNKSLLIFAGEAYNVEQGVSNEVFPNERATAAGCQYNPNPEDSTNLAGNSAATGASDTAMFAAFIRLSAPPTPVAQSPSAQNGHRLFGLIGCALCHTETLTTGSSVFTGMGNLAIHPYSDIAVHQMGHRLADFVNQGNAGFDEFRTAPLWGAGQRIFFLHDGRAGPANGGLLTAIVSHRSHNPACAPGQHLASDGTACNSEANRTVNLFLALPTPQQQDILNFLRSL